jgi:hypothetical protein
MSIEKSLYAAPVGLEQVLNNEEPDIEITIEDPESVEIGIDGMPILRIEEDDEEDDFDENLAWTIALDDQDVALGAFHFDVFSFVEGET